MISVEALILPTGSVQSFVQSHESAARSMDRIKAQQLHTQIKKASNRFYLTVKRVSGEYCAESAAPFSVCLPSYHGGHARGFGGSFEAQGGSNGVSRS